MNQDLTSQRVARRLPLTEIAPWLNRLISLSLTLSLSVSLSHTHTSASRPGLQRCQGDLAV